MTRQFLRSRKPQFEDRPLTELNVEVLTEATTDHGSPLQLAVVAGARAFVVALDGRTLYAYGDPVLAMGEYVQRLPQEPTRNPDFTVPNRTLTAAVRTAIAPFCAR